MAEPTARGSTEQRPRPTGSASDGRCAHRNRTTVGEEGWRTMSELHWTGAALLLAVAVLSGGSPRRPRALVMTWDEFARQHRLGVDALESVRQAPVVKLDAVRGERPRQAS